MSACVGPARIMDGWPPSRGEAIHTSTFLGNPLSCAAGLSFLGELARQGLVERAKVLGKKLLDNLRRVLAPVPEVLEVRGRGLLLGVEFQDPGTGMPMAGAAARLALRCLQEGLLVLPAGDNGHVLQLSPPLVITEAQLDWACETLGRVARESAAE